MYTGSAVYNACEGGGVCRKGRERGKGGGWGVAKGERHTGCAGGVLELLPKMASPGFWRGTKPGRALLSVLASAST